MAENGTPPAHQETAWRVLRIRLKDLWGVQEDLRRRLLGLMMEESCELVELVSMLRGLSEDQDEVASLAAFPPLAEDRWALSVALEKGDLEAALMACERRRRQLLTAVEMVKALRALAWVVDLVDVENWLATRLREWGGSIPRRTGDLVPLVGAYIFSQRFDGGVGAETRAAILGVIEELGVR
jgi:hypothetical protein